MGRAGPFAGWNAKCDAMTVASLSRVMVEIRDLQTTACVLILLTPAGFTGTMHGREGHDIREPQGGPEMKTASPNGPSSMAGVPDRSLTRCGVRRYCRRPGAQSTMRGL
jgi:D-alanyl-D-alanine carboxypeptidase